MFEEEDRSVSGIHYQLVNMHTGKPCLAFLHGLGGDITPFNPIQSFFHNLGYSSIALDLRGQGKSIRPANRGDYALEKIAEDVHKILDAGNFPRYIMIGHSGGGIIAQIVCSRYTDKYHGLVLLNSTSKINSIIAKLVRNKWFYFLISACISTLPNWYEGGYADFRKFIGTTDYDLKRIGSDIKHTGLRSYLTLFIELMRYDGTEAVKLIKIPTLVVSGGKDTVFTYKQVKETADGIANSSYVCIEETNHISVINHPQAVCEEIEKFLVSVC